MQSLAKGLLISAAVTVSGAAFVPLVASAQSAPTTYTAELKELNNSGGSGTFTLELNGSEATITGKVSGLADKLPESLKGGPYPHVQHIHIGGQGVCPSMADDGNKDGVLNTAEGQPKYGPIGVSLTKSGDTSPAAGTALNVAPTGASFDYSRTIKLDAKSMESVTAGKGVIVVHGLDPAKLPAAGLEPSELVPELPLAATSPALCGTLVAGQMGQTPSGAPQTGGGSTSGTEQRDLLIVGGGLLVAGGAAFGLRNRRFNATSS